MGSVIGIENVEEPAYKVLVNRNQKAVATTYEVREYGKRVAIETNMEGKDDSAFFQLAKYIGVIGPPQNEGQQAIAMTAPVVMSSGTPGGEKIAMTAPVVRTDRTMQFILPKEYDSLSKAPKPTNSDVVVKELPAEVGVVKRYSGSLNAKNCAEKAQMLGLQLREDGLEEMTEDFVSNSHRFFGYNPPFCLPMFRRNEVWIPLTNKQVEYLRSQFPMEESPEAALN